MPYFDNIELAYEYRFITRMSITIMKILKLFVTALMFWTGYIICLGIGCIIFYLIGHYDIFTLAILEFILYSLIVLTKPLT